LTAGDQVTFLNAIHNALGTGLRLYVAESYAPEPHKPEMDWLQNYVLLVAPDIEAAAELARAEASRPGSTLQNEPHEPAVTQIWVRDFGAPAAAGLLRDRGTLLVWAVDDA
jgi:hypothetical protein